MFKLVLSVFLCFIFNGLELRAQNRHQFVIEEPTENGKVLYKVFEEDQSLVQEQSRISQYLIYSKIAEPHQKNKILKLALKNQKDLSRSNFSMNKDLTKAGKPLWLAQKNSWSIEDEKSYSQWFLLNANVLFNQKSQLLADCTDVGLLFRWIYARDNKLPIANTLTGSGKLFGHFSGSESWDKLPTDVDWKKDERFKQALRYLFNNTYTHSVYNDLYPTEINSNYVRPGSMYMIIRKKSGHTQSIWQINQQQASLRTLWGNEPATEKIFESWIIWEAAVKNQFGSWRWPYLDKTPGQNPSQYQWKLIKAENMPGYSKEQFIKRQELGEQYFRTWVLDRLGLVDFDQVKLERELQNIKDSLSYRYRMTIEGALICGYKPCDVAGSDYDGYSTHSRDSRMLQTQKDVLSLIEQLGGINTPVVQNIITKLNLSQILIEGLSYTYADYIFSTSLLNSTNPDANLSFAKRWGINQFPDLNARYYSLIQLLIGNLFLRQEKIDLAYNYCHKKKCEFGSPYIMSLSTQKMDFGFFRLGEELNQIIQNANFDRTNFFQTRSQLKKEVLSKETAVISSNCEDSTNCMISDAVMDSVSFNRMSKWKFRPEDLIHLRWGL